MEACEQYGAIVVLDMGRGERAHRRSNRTNSA